MSSLPSSLPLLVSKNLALIGPPGSGKGSYGKLLAQALQIPLLTTSDVLRHYGIQANDGTLIDDETVSTVLQEYLLVQKQPYYIFDGFPRTLTQVKRMQETWPVHRQVHAAISLEVPKSVCHAKLLGRRFCTKCGGNYNVHAVQHEGFDLPAQIPKNCTHTTTTTNNVDANVNDCQIHWTSRPDDTPDITERRLETHYTTTSPILDHFEERGALLRFAPYKGYDDMPRFETTVTSWLAELMRVPSSTDVLSSSSSPSTA